MRVIRCYCILLFTLLCAGLTADGLYDPVAVYLTWQRSPETTMTVQWITLDDRQEDTIEYYRTDDPQPQWRSSSGQHHPVPGLGRFLVHSVELTNLSPHTDYCFRAGRDGKVYKFRTMPAALNGQVAFVVGGDIYHDGIDKVIETNQQAAQTSPMFALVGGDLAYAGDKFGILPEGMQSWMDRMLAGIDVRPDKRQRWLEWLIAWKDHMVTPEGRLIPMVPVIGNHDVNGGFDKTPAEAACFHAFFPMPGKRGYNVLDFGNYLTIVILDSGHTNPVGGKQTRWLYETLRARQFVPHKMAIYHVPAYPSVRNFNGKVCSSIRHFWTPVFDRFGLHAAFEHHDHAFKRTYPIRAGKIDPMGTVYMGDGAWGVEQPRIPKNPQDVWYLAKTASRRHFIRVTLSEDHRRISAIASTGESLDEYDSGR